MYYIVYKDNSYEYECGVFAGVPGNQIGYKTIELAQAAFAFYQTSYPKANYKIVKVTHEYVGVDPWREV